MADRMRIRKGYVYIGVGLLVLGCLIVYRFPNAFYLHSGGWRMYPREWVHSGSGPRTYGSFTYLTYNLLNDYFMRGMMDSYQSCNGVQDFMNLTIRQSHILIEVETMNPDVACFQEIDYKWYDTFWYPQLAARGYEGMLGVDQSHLNRVGQAIFWKKSKFNMDFNEKHFYHDLVRRYVENTLQDHEQTDFLAWFKTRSLLLLAELVDKRSSADAKIIVGCTHISAVQTKSPSMQTLQVALAMQRMDAFSQTRGTKAMILSGDFNTPPDFPAYEFIKSGRVTDAMKKSFEAKTPLHKLEPNMKKFALDVLDLMPVAFSHELYMRSAYHSVTGSEPRTTCLGDSTLDYIWYNPDHLVASAVLKEPTISRYLQERRTEACSLFSSDHLPVAAQFYFSSTTTIDI